MKASHSTTALAGNMINMFLLFGALIFSSCENPMAKIVLEARAVAGSPAISIKSLSDSVALAHGSTKDLGVLPFSSDSLKPYVFRLEIGNSGNTPLVIDIDAIALTVPEGQDANLFIISAPPEPVVKPSGKTIFEIAFSPTVSGQFQSDLHIPTNDYRTPEYVLTIKAIVSVRLRPSRYQAAAIQAISRSR